MSICGRRCCSCMLLQVPSKVCLHLFLVLELGWKGQSTSPQWRSLPVNTRLM